MELPKEPQFYPNDSVSIAVINREEETTCKISARDYEVMKNRFNEDPICFIMAEALKIFCKTDNEVVAIEALKLLEKAQPY